MEEQELGTLPPRDDGEEEPGTGITPYHHQPPAPAPRPSQPTAPVSFRDFQSFVDEISSDESLKRSMVLAETYDKVCRSLLGENDVQVEGRKEFKKKSAWRKLGRHFHISVEAVKEPHGRWERLPHDDAAHYVAFSEVYATAPWGQTMPGFGACSTREARFYTSGPQCPSCGGAMWDNRRDDRGDEDFACKDKGSCGGVLMPGDWDPKDLGRIPNPVARGKAEHDCLATAQTRAINRAVSELIGMGEVSWEEVEDGDHHSFDRGRPESGPAKKKGKPARGQKRSKAPSLDDTVPFGKYKGSTYRQVADDHPSDAWWYVKKAEKLPQKLKDDLAEYLTKKAETGAQEAEERANQANGDHEATGSPLEAQVPSGKHEGSTWAELAMSDPDYVEQMTKHAWGQEHYPEGSELRAALEVVMMKAEPNDKAVFLHWMQTSLTGAGTFVAEYARVHPHLPNDPKEWGDGHWTRALKEARKFGWEELRSRVQKATEKNGGGDSAGNTPEPLPKRLRERVTTTLGMAARHHFPEVKTWRLDIEKAADAGDVAMVARLVDNLGQELLAHIGRGKSPVTGAKEEAQKALDLGGEEE